MTIIKLKIHFVNVHVHLYKSLTFYYHQMWNCFFAYLCSWCMSSKDWLRVAAAVKKKVFFFSPLLKKRRNYLPFIKTSIWQIVTDFRLWYHTKITYNSNPLEIFLELSLRQFSIFLEYLGVRKWFESHIFTFLLTELLITLNSIFFKDLFDHCNELVAFTLDPFFIATTPRCRGVHYSILRIAPLYPWSLPAEC